MRFKQLLLAGLCLAGLTSAGFAQAPYIAAVGIDTTYSSYRSGLTVYDDYPTSLYDAKFNPYPWSVLSGGFLDIRVDPDDTVTGVYWSAWEEWNYDSWPGYCVYKNPYTRSNNASYPVHNHYQPISSRSISISAPSSGNNWIGTELAMSPYRRSIYVPVLRYYANGYYVVNGSAYSAVTWYIDGTYVIYNG